VSESARQQRASFPPRELIVRLLSAIVLAMATIFATWSGSLPFAVLVAGVAGVLVWEWGRLLRGTGLDAPAAAGLLVVLVAIGLVVAGRPLAGLLVLLAGAVATQWPARRKDRLLEVAGILYAGLPALALAWLRGAPEHGLQAVLLVLLVVWATDTGAFVAGRSLGGPRLWPSVSPNKTWSGLLGGVLSGAVVAWLFARSLGSAAPGQVAVLALVLAALSQLGDLAESALKRARGVKDTSQLIPGHGGFMDRVDGLVFAAVAAAIYAALAGPSNPAATLLALR